MCEEVIQGFISVYDRPKKLDIVVFQFKEEKKKGQILDISGSIVKVKFEDGSCKFIRLEYRKEEYIGA